MYHNTLSNRWRPKLLDDMVGQEEILFIVKNILKNKYLHHSFIVSGSHGVGKTSFARIFAKCLNCEVGITFYPCNECYCCRSIDNFSNFDVIEIDGASKSKIDDIKDLFLSSNYKVFRNRFRIYIIDECHMLSISSFNFLLKSLEEENRNNIYILITTNLDKVPKTIKSRCINLEFKKIDNSSIKSRLKYILNKEKVVFDNNFLDRLIIFSDGSIRNLINILEKFLSYKKIDNFSMYKIFSIVSFDLLFSLFLSLIKKKYFLMLDIINKILKYNLHVENFVIQCKFIILNIILYKLKIKYDRDFISSYYFIYLSNSSSIKSIQIIYNYFLKARLFFKLSSNLNLSFNMFFINIYFKINS